MSRDQLRKERAMARGNLSGLYFIQRVYGILILLTAELHSFINYTASGTFKKKILNGIRQCQFDIGRKASRITFALTSMLNLPLHHYWPNCDSMSPRLYTDIVERRLATDIVPTIRSMLTIGTFAIFSRGVRELKAI